MMFISYPSLERVGDYFLKYFYKKPNKYVASAYFVYYNIHKVEAVIKWFDKTNKKGVAYESSNICIRRKSSVD